MVANGDSVNSARLTHDANSDLGVYGGVQQQTYTNSNHVYMQTAVSSANPTK